MRRTLLALIALTVPAALALPLSAQRPDRAPLRLTRFHAGLDLAVAQPVGAFADEVGAAGGANLHAAYYVTPAFSLRTDGTILIYGHERLPDVCAASTCRVRFDLTTDNQILSGFLGAQLEVPYGPVRPYLRGGAGVGYFFTTSSLGGTSSESTFATSTNFDDAVFAWTGGGGVLFPFRIREVPLAVDFGARFQRNGDVSYLRKGSGITDNPDGSITLHPTHGSADFVVWHLGASVNIPRGRRH